MNEDEIKSKIDNDPDFIAIKRFDFSMKKLLDRYEEGAPIHIICQALLMTEKEVEALYQNILVKLREILK